MGTAKVIKFSKAKTVKTVKGKKIINDEYCLNEHQAIKASIEKLEDRLYEDEEKLDEFVDKILNENEEYKKLKKNILDSENNKEVHEKVLDSFERCIYDNIKEGLSSETFFLADSKRTSIKYADVVIFLLGCLSDTSFKQITKKMSDLVDGFDHFKRGKDRVEELKDGDVDNIFSGKTVFEVLKYQKEVTYETPKQKKKKTKMKTETIRSFEKESVDSKGLKKVEGE